MRKEHAEEGAQPEVEAPTKKGSKKPSVCFILSCAVAAVANIGSFCTTDNHWADDVTSKALVKDIVVPFFRRKINQLRAVNESSCKAFGMQVCVLIVDVWYGWLDAGFKTWLSATYPWIRLLFVPARCTPVAQPMDRGVFAKIKGILRHLYGSWVVNLVQQQLAKGIRLPCSLPAP